MESSAGLRGASDFGVTLYAPTRAHTCRRQKQASSAQANTDPARVGRSSPPSCRRDVSVAFTQTPASSTLRAPKPAHNLATSPELRRQRQEQQAAAQALTSSLVTCRTVAEAVGLYECHGEQFNAIHFAALFTALGRLATATSHPPSYAPGPHPPTSSPMASSAKLAAASPSRHCSTPAFLGLPTSSGILHPHLTPHRHSTAAAAAVATAVATAVAARDRDRGPHLPPPASSAQDAPCSDPITSARPRSRPRPVPSPAALSHIERVEMRRFVLQRLVPHVGLRLMGFGSRQLATVLAALASLECPPPTFWLSEWLQHFARRLETPPPSRGAAATYAEGGARHAHSVAAAAGAVVPEAVGPGLETAVDASSAEPSSRYTTTDIARAMWALAQLQTMHQAGAVDMAAAAAGATVRAATAWVQQGPSASTEADGRPLADDLHRFTNACPRHGPSLGWLQTVSYAFAAKAPSASPADLASFLWAAARLGYRPPATVMAALMSRCTELIGNSHYRRRGHAALDVQQHAGSSAGAAGPRHPPRMGPRELSEVLWALAVLGFHPGGDWLRRVSADLAHMAGSAAPKPAAARLEPAAFQQAPAGALPSETVEQFPPAAAATEETDWWSDHLRGDSGTPVAVGIQGGSSGVAGDGGGGAAAAISLDSRQAATCIWVFARLGFHPSEPVLTALLRCACACAPMGTAGPAAAEADAAAALQDLSMASFALGVLRFRPGPDQTMAMLVRMAARLSDASAQDLVVWVTALARMRLAVPDPWFAAYTRRAARELEALSPLALVNWIDAVSRLRTARLPRRRRLEQQLALEPQQAKQAQQALLRRPGRIVRGTGLGVGGGGAAAAGNDAASSGLTDRTSPATTALAITALAKPVFGVRRVAPAVALPPGNDNSSAVCTSAEGDGDPWVMVPLPKAKPPRGTNTGAGPRRPHCRRLSARRRNCRVAGRTPGATSPPSPAPLPVAPSPQPRPDAAVAAAAATAEAAASAEAAAIAASPAATGVTTGKLGPVFIRPAARHLQRQWLLPRLLRLTGSRLQQLDLEQHCRLAWAVAHLDSPVPRGWLDALLETTSDALERRLRLCYAQQQKPLPLPQSPREDASAAKVVLVHKEEGASAATAQVPVADARWLLKLARAVDLMIRGPGRSGSRRRRMEMTRRRSARHDSIDITANVAPPLQLAATPAALVPHRKDGGAVFYTYVPRRWRLLLMMAMLPQLSALTNAQLLRFVRALARLRGGPAAVAAAVAASASPDVSCAGVFGAAGGASGGKGRGRRGRQHRVTAELGSYCRRRVEATCGAAEACDLTTLELLRWTRGWERSEMGDPCRRNAGRGAQASLAWDR